MGRWFFHAQAFGKNLERIRVRCPRFGYHDLAKLCVAIRVRRLISNPEQMSATAAGGGGRRQRQHAFGSDLAGPLGELQVLGPKVVAPLGTLWQPGALSPSSTRPKAGRPPVSGQGPTQRARRSRQPPPSRPPTPSRSLFRKPATLPRRGLSHLVQRMIRAAQSGEAASASGGAKRKRKDERRLSPGPIGTRAGCDHVLVLHLPYKGSRLTRCGSFATALSVRR